MDADGLPLVGPGIDYTKVEAINQKRTIAFINHFITHTSRFLNRFACVCEDKLENLHGRIQQLEISLSLLEAKLSSIPGLDSVTAPSSTSTPAVPAGAAAAAQSSGTTSAPGEAPTPVPETDGETQAEEAKAAHPVSKDPRYAKFFKMLQVGVPEPAVKGKMIMEGLDPNMLDTPNAPAPIDDDSKTADADADSDEDSFDSDASFSD